MSNFSFVCGIPRRTLLLVTLWVTILGGSYILGQREASLVGRRTILTQVEVIQQAQREAMQSLRRRAPVAPGPDDEIRS